MCIGEARDLVDAGYCLFTLSSSSDRTAGSQSAVAVCRSPAFASDRYGTFFQISRLIAVSPMSSRLSSYRPDSGSAPCQLLHSVQTLFDIYMYIYAFHIQIEFFTLSGPPPWCLVLSGFWKSDNTSRHMVFSSSTSLLHLHLHWE